MARWTAVDTETGEIIEFASRSSMRAAVRANPALRGREREAEYERKHPPEKPPIVMPLWHATHWTADTVSMKRERAFDNATAGLRFSFMKAINAGDAKAATEIRLQWEQNVKAYAEGRIDANAYTAGMANLVGWLSTTPYEPPVPIHYHEGSDDYDPGEESPDEDWEDFEYDVE